MARPLKFRGDQERRRFVVGVAIDARCTAATATMIAATGRGLEARFEIASHAIEPVPQGVRESFERLTSDGDQDIRHVCEIASQLAEVEAAAVDQLANLESEVWHRTLALGVADPGIWLGTGELRYYMPLCDAARLAELTGQNTVDAFAARDLAQDGHGESLDAVPLWLLFHHPQADRLLIEPPPGCRLVYLPASRDESGASRVEVWQAEPLASLCQWLKQSWNDAAPETSIPMTSAVRRRHVEEIVVFSDVAEWEAQGVELRRIIGTSSHHVEAEALSVVCAAVLALLLIDQTPANLPMITGAAAPRVLGRLTPGSVAAWNRLLRDLAFARPLITPLRAAM